MNFSQQFMFYFTIATLVAVFIIRSNTINGFKFDNKAYTPPSKKSEVITWISFKKGIIYGLTWPFSGVVMLDDYLKTGAAFWDQHMVPCYEGDDIYKFWKSPESCNFAELIHAMVCPN